MARGASSAMVRGALFGFVVALASLVIVTLFEPFKAGVVEARVAFTVLPLIGRDTFLSPSSGRAGSTGTAISKRHRVPPFVA